MTHSFRSVDRAIAVIAGVTTGLMLSGQIGRGFDYDESVAVFTVISRGSAKVALTETYVFNNHPLFAALQSEWWDLVGAGETRQRILPVFFGALAVALLAGWCTRRFGALAGVSAAAIVIVNPMFVTNARALRGYSLAMLGVVVAVLALVEYVRQGAPPNQRGRKLLTLHALGIVVAMGTHVFSGVAIGSVGFAALLILRTLDLRLVRTWLISATVTVLLYLPTLRDLASTAETGSEFFRPWFGRAVLSELLGRNTITAVAISGLFVYAMLTLIVSRCPRRSIGIAALFATSLVAGQILFVWLLVSPVHLYPRFFLPVVPLVAAVASFAVSVRPALIVVVAVSVLVSLGQALDERSRTTGHKDAGAIVSAVDFMGGRVCAVGGESLWLYASGAPIAELSEFDRPPNDVFAECDLFVRVGSWGRSLDGPAAEHFAHRTVIGEILVFSVDPVGSPAP